MTANEYCFVLSAIDNRERAEAIAEAAVTKRLAAAVNIIDGVTSIYRWKGTIEKNRELLLLFYTRRTLADPVATLIKEMHPYELPPATVIDIAGGAEDFLEWIGGNTAAYVEDY